MASLAKGHRNGAGLAALSYLAVDGSFVTAKKAIIWQNGRVDWWCFWEKTRQNSRCAKCSVVYSLIHSIPNLYNNKDRLTSIRIKQAISRISNKVLFIGLSVYRSLISPHPYGVLNIVSPLPMPPALLWRLQPHAERECHFRSTRRTNTGVESGCVRELVTQLCVFEQRRRLVHYRILQRTKNADTQ